MEPLCPTPGSSSASSSRQQQQQQRAGGTGGGTPHTSRSRHADADNHTDAQANVTATRDAHSATPARDAHPEAPPSATSSKRLLQHHARERVRARPRSHLHAHAVGAAPRKAAAAAAAAAAASTTPRASATAARTRHRPLQNSNPEPVPCPQIHCRNLTTSFLCQHCLRQKIQKYADNMIRVAQLRDGARERAEAMLGVLPLDQGNHCVSSLKTSPARATRSHAAEDAESAVPDPFGPPSDLPRNPHGSASHHARSIQAQWSQLSTRIAQRQRNLMHSEDAIAALRARIQSKRQALEQRRDNLQAAQCILDGDDDHRRRRHGQGYATGQTMGPAARRKALEIEVLVARRKAADIGEQLSRARRLRQGQLLSFFAVAPPVNARDAASADSARAMSRLLSARSQGAADRRPQPKPSPLSHDWTILPTGSQVALPLPTASDIRRFSVDDINAAVTFTTQLLQSLAVACGVALPFSIGIDEDAKWALRQDNISKGNGTSDVSHSLYLTKAAYEAICDTAAAGKQSASSGPRASIEASVLSIGASTLSTLESYVTLHGLSHKSWAKASILGGKADTAGKAQDKDAVGKPDDNRSSTSSTSTTKTRRDRDDASFNGNEAGRSFCCALLMLAYDAAFLAWTQGVHVDLVKAGGSTLRLLFEAATAVHKKSHLAVPPAPNALQDLTFPLVDFSKLLQLYELHDGPYSAPPSSHSGSSATSSRAAASAGRSAVAQKHTRSASRDEAVEADPRSSSGMEDSYIDAGQAAASILLTDRDLEQGHSDDAPTRKRTSATPTTLSPSPKGHSTAQVQAPGSSFPLLRPHVQTPPRSAAPATAAQSRPPQPLPASKRSDVSNVKPANPGLNLDFLRQRGQRATASPVQSGAKTALERDAAEGSSTNDRPRSAQSGTPSPLLAGQYKPAAASGGDAPSSQNSGTAALAREQDRGKGKGRETGTSASGASSARTSGGASAPTPSATSNKDADPARGAEPRPSKPGTVIFNGLEVEVKERNRTRDRNREKASTTGTRGTARGPAVTPPSQSQHRATTEEDEWDVV